MFREYNSARPSVIHFDFEHSNDNVKSNWNLFFTVDWEKRERKEEEINFENSLHTMYLRCLVKFYVFTWCVLMIKSRRVWQEKIKRLVKNWVDLDRKDFGHTKMTLFSIRHTQIRQHGSLSFIINFVMPYDDDDDLCQRAC